MKLTLIALAIAGTTLAAPRSASQRPKRRSVRHASSPKIASFGPAALTSNDTRADYSPNWSGAVLSRSTATWVSVTGTFTLPTLKAPAGNNTAPASAWVGIDGSTCPGAVLQTGVDFILQGAQSHYEAWYEWYPDYAYDFAGISLSAGDSVTTTVKATSKTSGTATIINNSKGITVSHTFSAQHALCEYDAEWIVENYDSPLANFGTVTFTNAYATETDGTKVYPPSSTIINIEQSGKVLTSCSVSSSSVTCTYV